MQCDSEHNVGETVALTFSDRSLDISDNASCLVVHELNADLRNAPTWTWITIPISIVSRYLFQVVAVPLVSAISHLFRSGMFEMVFFTQLVMPLTPNIPSCTMYMYRYNRGVCAHQCVREPISQSSVKDNRSKRVSSLTFVTFTSLTGAFPVSIFAECSCVCDQGLLVEGFKRFVVDSGSWFWS